MKLTSITIKLSFLIEFNTLEYSYSCNGAPTRRPAQKHPEMFANRASKIRKTSFLVHLQKISFGRLKTLLNRSQTDIMHCDAEKGTDTYLTTQKNYNT